VSYGVSIIFMKDGRGMKGFLRGNKFNYISPGPYPRRRFVFIGGSFAVYSKKCVASPLRSFGSNQVDLGGMTLPASATFMSWSIRVA
jgi:hypothetical protein